MIETLETPAWDPSDLYNLLEEHGLISGAFKSYPVMLNSIAGHSRFSVWIRGEDPVAVMLEMPEPEPGTLNIMLIPLDKELGRTYRVEVADLAKKLRPIWFESYRRVQAMVPASRVNMQRCLKALGFQEETRHGVGMRGLVQLGSSAPEAMLIYGLLESDPHKVWAESVTAKIACVEENA